SSRAAEAVKLTENIFRSVNIALINELKAIYQRMGIDVWEVINGAKSKPFGYMPFYPGPGLGGHCIPIDPFYLTYKAKEFDMSPRFIELAGEINTGMPYFVIEQLALAMEQEQNRVLRGATVLVLGASYKKNIGDTRESPALKLLDLLQKRGVNVLYHDPYVPQLNTFRHFPSLEGMQSVDLTQGLESCDAVLICTDHDQIDYQQVATAAPLIVDTRNAMRSRGLEPDHLIQA
ncbi:MAG: nucleotide sugar dehydrogenase, partial [Pseudomonadota bacterium]